MLSPKRVKYRKPHLTALRGYSKGATEVEMCIRDRVRVHEVSWQFLPLFLNRPFQQVADLVDHAANLRAVVVIYGLIEPVKAKSLYYSLLTRRTAYRALLPCDTKFSHSCDTS